MNKTELMSLLDRIPNLGFIKDSGDNHVSVACLMAPWRHERGYDRKPSMTISHGTGPSFVTCWACQYKSPLSKMMFELSTLRKGDVAKVAIETGTLEARPYFQVPKSKNSLEEVLTLNYDDSLAELSKFPWSRAGTDFLATKGISPRMREYGQLAFLPGGTSVELADLNDPISVTVDTIIIPVVGLNQNSWRCIGAYARPLTTFGSKYYAILPFQRSKHLYGEQNLGKIKGAPLLLVEGFFDVLHLYDEGVLSTGLMGTGLSKTQARIISQSRPSRVYLLMDPDGPGQLAARGIEQTLKTLGLPVTNIKLDRDPKFQTKQQILSYIS